MKKFSKRIIRYDKVAFISVMKRWFDLQNKFNIIFHKNKLKKKSSMLIAWNAEEVSDKI